MLSESYNLSLLTKLGPLLLTFLALQVFVSLMRNLHQREIFLTTSLKKRRGYCLPVYLRIYLATLYPLGHKSERNSPNTELFWFHLALLPWLKRGSPILCRRLWKMRLFLDHGDLDGTGSVPVVLKCHLLLMVLHYLLILRLSISAHLHGLFVNSCCVS
nr:hypothetical protein 1 [signal crayfish associated partiti-like virus 1]